MHIPAEAKQRTRQRRERWIRRWLTSLSWTLPAVAYGGFWSLWHSALAAGHPAVQTTAGTSPGMSTSTSAPSPSSAHTPETIWKMGDSGWQVQAIQRMLGALGYFGGPDTGYFGAQTRVAVEHFQAAHGLPITGTVDRATLDALNLALRNEQRRRLTQGLGKSAPATPPASPRPSTVAPPVHGSQETAPHTTTSASRW